MYSLANSLPWLGFFAAITLSWIFYLKARNRERLALIEKGVDAPDAFKAAKFPWLKIGIVIIGICLGAALVVLSYMFKPGLSRQFFAILLILSGLFFGGIAMVIAHYIDRKREE